MKIMTNIDNLAKMIPQMHLLLVNTLTIIKKFKMTNYNFAII